MDYVGGETLEDLIEQKGLLDAGFCLPIFASLRRIDGDAQ